MDMIHLYIHLDRIHLYVETCPLSDWFRSVDFIGNTVGLAYTEGICTGNSVAVNQVQNRVEIYKGTHPSVGLKGTC